MLSEKLYDNKRLFSLNLPSFIFHNQLDNQPLLFTLLVSQYTEIIVNMAMIPPAPPKSVLGRHRILAPTASVRVSPLCLGGMSTL